MNVKIMLFCWSLIGLLFVCCSSGSHKMTGNSGGVEKRPAVGNDKDEHGCIASAGYTWSEVQKDCIRLWEKGIRMNEVDNSGNTLFLVFSPDSTQVELFFSEEENPNEILDRRSLPSGGYAWNVKDDDTKNVRLKNGKWTVSQRNRLIYKQADVSGDR